MMSDDSAKHYLIPAPIRRGYEFFPGWGLAEVAVTLAGFLAGVLLFLVIWLVGGSFPLRLIGFLLGGGIGAGLAIPPPNGEPLYRRIEASWRYRRQPRRYPYDWRRPDWDEE